MSGFYKKAVVWLGLNEEYPDDDFGMGHEPAEIATDASESTPSPTPRPSTPDSAPTAKRPVGPKPEPRPATQRERVESDADPRPEAARTVESPNRYGARSAGEGTVRPIPMDEDPTPASTAPRALRTPPPDMGGTVRAVPMAKTVKPQLVVPQSFNDAQDVADMFREKKPVIVNMQSAERDLARRLIDFSSGLCYGLGGQMEKVAKDVYLLTPDDVEVADEHRVVPQS